MGRRRKKPTDSHLHRPERGAPLQQPLREPADGPGSGVPQPLEPPAEAARHPNQPSEPPEPRPGSKEPMQQKAAFASQASPAPPVQVHEPFVLPPQPHHFHIKHIHEPDLYPEDPNPENWIVTFKGVNKVFGSGSSAFTAVKDVNFRVYDIPDRGEFICVLGPSGCGKSTILNMIAGFYGPTTGQVLVRGKPVGGPGADRGFVFQNYSSFPHLTVWENVAFGLFCQELKRPRNPLVALLDSFVGIRGRRRQKLRDEAMEWVRKVNLDGNEYKYPHQLSGGMRQRVAIARTLALKPDIILMDEPFGALDRVTRWEMQDLLIKIWDEVEATVFLITHDLEEAVFLGDRIYIMSESPGTILEETGLPRPEKPAAVAQREPEFGDVVREISAKVEHNYFENQKLKNR